MALLNAEFGGFWKHEETQHALKNGRIVGLFTVAAIRKKKKKTSSTSLSL